MRGGVLDTRFTAGGDVRGVLDNRFTAGGGQEGWLVNLSEVTGLGLVTFYATPFCLSITPPSVHSLCIYGDRPRVIYSLTLHLSGTSSCPT